VNLKCVPSGSRDWRILTTTVTCLVIGFLAGMLVFGKPWHLPPDWGDIPTWLAAFFAGIAGVVALRQLGMLRQQMADEAERSAKRDEILDSQVAEARIARRRQASRIKTEVSTSEPMFHLSVINGSDRPISGITCKVMSAVQGPGVESVVAEAEKHGMEEENIAGRWLVPSASPGSWVDDLPPGKRCRFIFSDSVSSSSGICVVWFTDEAGRRWQLDTRQYLGETEGENYKLQGYWLTW
jgi:hypothetical protein